YNIGGEQSGHIIFLDHATTGDGQLSGAKIIEILVNSGVKMSELASVMEAFPQLMLNVKIKPEHRVVWKDDENVKSVMSYYEEKLGDDGRILVRESGTEPLIRVMVECKDSVLMEEACRSIASAIEEFVQK
ncbi:MAG: phosphoglucosamine mutase, partial [Ruminococcus sp.]|nr:phosphoglucosamine mutase [Ruminococcus sp.]